MAPASVASPANLLPQRKAGGRINFLSICDRGRTHRNSRPRPELTVSRAAIAKSLPRRAVDAKSAPDRRRARQHARGCDRPRGPRLPQQARHHRRRSRRRRRALARHAVEDRERPHLAVADHAAALSRALGVPVTAFFRRFEERRDAVFVQGRRRPCHRAARHARRPPVPASRPYRRHHRAASWSSPI